MVADLPYARPPISTYLQQFYSGHPGCDFTPLAGASFQLADCHGCGCLYQVNVPDAEYLAHFYGQGLYGSGTKTPESLEPYAVEHSVRELMSVIRFLQPRVPRPRLLDFGAGNGAWARLAAASGAFTHACDLSGHAFPELERLGITCHGPGELPAATFDFINAEQVFEHLPSPRDELQLLARALKPGGVLKIGVPHDPGLRRKLRRPDWTAPKNSAGSLNGVAPIEHLNHFEPASVQAMAKWAGMESLEVRGWDLTIPRAQPVSRPPRAALGRWLRARLGQDYRPHHALTQTAFFRKPDQCCSPSPCP